MNKLNRILIVFVLMVSVASAAVFVTYNPEASIYFDRPNPDPDVLPVQSFIMTKAGTWTNSYGFGTMAGDVMDIEMAHKNGDASDVTAAVYFEIECEEGLVDGTSSGTIKDFEQLVYIDPDGVSHSCNNIDAITRLSDTKIRVVPNVPEYTFTSGTYIGTNLKIYFIGMAYGNYIVTVYVDEKVNIGLGD